MTRPLDDIRVDAVTVSTYDATRVQVDIVLDVSRLVGDGVTSRGVAEALDGLFTREAVTAALRRPAEAPVNDFDLSYSDLRDEAIVERVRRALHIVHLLGGFERAEQIARGRR